MKRQAFAKLVQLALDRIPEEFQAALKNLAIVISDHPSPKIMKEMTDGPDETLYGLYQGVPLPERGADYSGTTPDVIILYQKPLEEDFPNRRDLIREIETTLVHEIAHYFGFGEEVLERYGYD
ncbi:MAG TPA: metallopeptidase family protein [Nitrospiria bacterium]|nr:metallopeptidase family protein [Nitrospiria bacterium]